MKSKVLELIDKPDVIWEDEKIKDRENTISDGYHTISDGYQFWSIVCPTCNQATMEIVRPGKVKCSNCG